jgi:hypothetical protein
VLREEPALGIRRLARANLVGVACAIAADGEANVREGLVELANPATRTGESTQAGATRQGMLETAHDFHGMPYLLFTPDLGPTRGQRSRLKWRRLARRRRHPLIVFLHGQKQNGGEVASVGTLDKLKQTGLPKLAAEGKLPRIHGRSFPMIVASPQVSAASDVDMWSRYLEGPSRLVISSGN